MIKTKDGYVKMIDSKYQGHDHKLLSSNGGDWEVHKSRNNEPDKIVRTDSTGAISTDKALIYSELSLNDKKAYIHRLGQSGTIGKGRDSAVIKTTSYSSNSTLFSHKSSTGSWDLSTSSNKLNLYYISDSYYNSGEGDFNALTFPNKTGTLATTLDIPSISIVAGKSKETVNAEEKNPYLMLISKVKDSAGVETVKNIGQVKILGTGSTNINSNANGSIYVSSVLYKAGTGLFETPVAATNITGYTTNTLAVKLDYQESGANYPVKSHTSGLYVTVPWRTIKVKGSSINRLELDLLEGDNVKLVKSNSEDGSTANVTISAKDTLYDAGSGLTLSGTTFKVNTGSDNKADRIFGVKVDTEDKLYTKVPWIEYKQGDGIVIANVDGDTTGYNKTISHKDTSSVDTEITYGPSQNVIGSDAATIDIPYIKVDTYGHITTLGTRTYTSKNTTYTAEDGIKLDTGGIFKHSHKLSNKKDAYGSTATTASAAKGTITVTDVQYNEFGHITKSTDRTITLSQDHYKVSNLSQGNSGLKQDGTGKEISVPYIEINSDGHITSYSTNTFTVSGFISSITPGTGLTGTDTDTAITDTGTINLKTASTSEIGGIKIYKDNTTTSVSAKKSSITAQTTFDRFYGLEIDSDDKAFTYVPWTDDRVTSVDYHYNPITDNNKQLNASGNDNTNITNSSTGQLNVIVGLKRDAAGHITEVISKKIYSTDTTQFTISAGDSDDDVVILTGTQGTNGVSYEASHAKKFSTTGSTYTSGNTVTSISGSGGSGTIKIPQITVDSYGHVTAAEDESVTITMPTIPAAPTLSDLGGISGISIADANKTNNPILTLTATKIGTTVTLGGSVAEMVGATSTKEGKAGLVPKPAKGEQTQYLKGNGTWDTPEDTTYSNGTGLALSTTNVFSLKTAASGQLGGIQLGYPEANKKYAVKLDSSNRAYVEVPWEADSWRPITNVYNGTDTATSLSQKGAKQLYDDLCDLIPPSTSISFEETGSRWNPIYINRLGEFTPSYLGIVAETSQTFTINSKSFSLNFYRYPIGCHTTEDEIEWWHYIVFVRGEIPYNCFKDTREKEKKCTETVPSGFRPSGGCHQSLWAGADGNEDNRGLSIFISSGGAVFLQGFDSPSSDFGGSTIQVNFSYVYRY